MADKILELKTYIEESLGDSGGAWEYEHEPTIKWIIEHFNEVESKRLLEEMWSWNENILYHLADAIFGNNVYLDKCFIYCKIFTLTNDTEKLDYLMENLCSAFEFLDIEACSLEFLNSFKDKIIEISRPIEDIESNPLLKLAEKRINSKKKTGIEKLSANHSRR